VRGLPSEKNDTTARACGLYVRGGQDANASRNVRGRLAAHRADLLSNYLSQRFIDPVLPTRPGGLKVIKNVSVNSQRDKLLGIRDGRALRREFRGLRRCRFKRRFQPPPVRWWFFVFCRQAFYVLSLGLHCLKRKLGGQTKAGSALDPTEFAQPLDECSDPMVGTLVDRCALTTSGHHAAPPSSVMNARRSISSMGDFLPYALSACRPTRALGFPAPSACHREAWGSPEMF